MRENNHENGTAKNKRKLKPSMWANTSSQDVVKAVEESGVMMDVGIDYMTSSSVSFNDMELMYCERIMELNSQIKEKELENQLLRDKMDELESINREYKRRLEGSEPTIVDEILQEDTLMLTLEERSKYLLKFLEENIPDPEFADRMEEIMKKNRSEPGRKVEF